MGVGRLDDEPGTMGTGPAGVLGIIAGEFGGC